MFLDIYDDGEGYWEISDTEFGTATDFPCCFHTAAETIMMVYQGRNLNTSHALQKYYERYSSKSRWSVLHGDVALIKSRNLRAHFVSKYYNCILHHIDKLDWIGK